MAKTVTSTRQLKFTKYFLESYLTRLAPNSHSITGGDHEYVYSDGYYATDLVITSLTALSTSQAGAQYLIQTCCQNQSMHLIVIYSSTSKQKRTLHFFFLTFPSPRYDL